MEKKKTLVTSEAIEGVYNEFKRSVDSTFGSIIDKLNVFGDERTKEVYNSKFFPFLVDSSVDLLHRFFIEVSKHKQGDEYKSLKFDESKSWSARIWSNIEDRLETENHEEQKN